MIFQFGTAIGSRAVGAAVNAIAFLHIVADDAAAALSALGREGMDGALEAVENMLLAFHDHFKRFLIIVSANFALSHIISSRAASAMDCKSSNQSALVRCPFYSLLLLLLLIFPAFISFIGAGAGFPVSCSTREYISK